MQINIIRHLPMHALSMARLPQMQRRRIQQAYKGQTWRDLSTAQTQGWLCLFCQLDWNCENRLSVCQRVGRRTLTQEGLESVFPSTKCLWLDRPPIAKRRVIHWWWITDYDRYRSLRVLVGEVAWPQIELHHDPAHKQVHRPICHKPTIKSLNPTLHSKSLNTLPDVFLSWLHHHRRGVIHLHLPHYCHERIGQEVAQSGWDYEAISWWLRNQLHPWQIKQNILYYKQRSTRKPQFWGSFTPNW